MKQNELVSFLIPCYREKEEHFKKAIDSVLNQTYPYLDIIIILDDPTNDLLFQLGREYASQDSRVRFLVNEKNLKLVNTLNKGIQLAKGKIIARLDSDDIAYPTRIEEQLKYIDQYDLISTNFAFINEDGDTIQHRKYPEDDASIKKYMVNVMDSMFHTTWLGKKCLFEKLNGYRNIGPFEDYDFLLRGIVHGAKYYNVQQELTAYRVNLQGISQTNKALQHLGSEYIRENYKRIDSITNKDIECYMNSPLGKQHIEEFEKYCKIKSDIFASSSTKSFYMNTMKKAIHLFGNYYGRKKIVDTIKYRM